MILFLLLSSGKNELEWVIIGTSYKVANANCKNTPESKSFALAGLGSSG